MKLSSLKMPAWWQYLWSQRYPCGVNGEIVVRTHDWQCYRLQPMGCGCGYHVLLPNGAQLPGHSPTIRGAMRRVRKHACSH